MKRPGINPEIYFRIKAAEEGIVYTPDSDLIKQIQGQILQLQDMMMQLLNNKQNDLIEIHQIDKRMIELDKRISICEHQIESKQYQYLKRYY